VSKNFKATSIYYSLKDGFHNRQDITHQYNNGFDMGYVMGVGADINAGNRLFQLNFQAKIGTKNVFNSNSFPGNTGFNHIFGVQIVFLY
jgi:hypothetical protein